MFNKLPLFAVVFFSLKQKGDTNAIASTIWHRKRPEYAKLKYISIEPKHAVSLGNTLILK